VPAIKLDKENIGGHLTPLQPSRGVRPSVCLSVTFMYSVEMNKHMFKIFSPSGSHTILHGVSKKVAPKTFWTSAKSFCVKFCKFVGNSYPHKSTNFRVFIKIFHQIALIFPRVPIVFTR